jgi:hypothetical protein
MAFELLEGIERAHDVLVVVEYGDIHMNSLKAFNTKTRRHENTRKIHLAAARRAA